MAVCFTFAGVDPGDMAGLAYRESDEQGCTDVMLLSGTAGDQSR